MNLKQIYRFTNIQFGGKGERKMIVKREREREKERK